MTHNGVYAGLVPSHRQQYAAAMQQTGQIGTGLAIGGGILAFLALGLALGVAPGALIAHYGFGLKWGKSIAIGFGVMLGLGVIERILRPAPVVIASGPQSFAPLSPAVAAVHAASP